MGWGYDFVFSFTFLFFFFKKIKNKKINSCVFGIRIFYNFKEILDYQIMRI
jgi:hypothetical protein